MNFYANATFTNLVLREWLNGSLFPLSANLAFIIGVFLWDSWLYSIAHPDGSRWWKMDGVPTACALFWIFSLESLRAGSVWIILRITNDGHEVPHWVREFTNVLLVVGGAGLAIMILRCTYLFTPPRWGNRFWLYSLATTLAFLLLSHFFPNIQP